MAQTDKTYLDEEIEVIAKAAASFEILRERSDLDSAIVDTASVYQSDLMYLETLKEAKSRFPKDVNLGTWGEPV